MEYIKSATLPLAALSLFPLKYFILNDWVIMCLVGATSIAEIYVQKKYDISIYTAVDIIVSQKTGYRVHDILAGAWIRKDDQVQIDTTNETITVRYTTNGESHHIVMHIPTTDSEIFDIVDADDGKVEKVTRALGPYNNFHNFVTTPGMFGCDVLKVGYLTPDLDIKYVTYGRSDEINLEYPDKIDIEKTV